MIPILSGIIVGQGGKVTAVARLLARVHVRAGHGAHVCRGRRGIRARCSSRRRRRSSRSRGSSSVRGALHRAGTRDVRALHAAAAQRAADAAHDVSNKQKSGTSSARSSWARCPRSSSPHAWRQRHRRSQCISQTGQVGAAPARSTRRPRHGRAAAARRRVRRLAAAKSRAVDGHGEVPVRRPVPGRRDLLPAQPLLPPSVAMLLWSVLAVVVGLLDLFAEGARRRSGTGAGPRPGLIAVVYGILLLIGVAAGGGSAAAPEDPARLVAAPAAAPAAVARRTGCAAKIERARVRDDQIRRRSAGTGGGRQRRRQDR